MGSFIKECTNNGINLISRISKKENRVIGLLFLFYIFPVISITLYKEIFFIQSVWPLYLRGAFLGLLSGSLALYCLANKEAFIEYIKQQKLILCSTGLAGLLIATSLYTNEGSLSLWMRGVLQYIHIILMIICLPFLIKKQKHEAMDFAAHIFIGITLALTILSVIWHLFDLSANARLVFPVDPHLWLVLSWFLAFRYFGYTLLAMLFTLGIIWTGSRLALLMILTAFLYYTVFVDRKNIIKKLCIPLAVIFIFLFTTDTLLPKKSPLFTYNIYANQVENSLDDAKQDATVNASRKYIWNAAIEKLRTEKKMLTGFGQNIYFPHHAKPRDVSAHNAFLKNGLLYGIIYSALAYILWFIVFMPKPIIPDLFKAQPVAYETSLFFFGVLTVESVLFNTFWTNISNIPVFFACLWLLYHHKRPV